MVTVRVERFNGEPEIIVVETFSAADLEAKMNDMNVVGISIGDQVFSRIDIKHAKVVEE